MDDDRQTELFIDISKNLGEINAKMSSLCDAIQKHEMRIQKLEQGGSADFKSQMIQYLCKTLIILGSSIAALVGASPIIKTLFRT